MRELQQVLLHDSLRVTASRTPHAEVIVCDSRRYTYEALLASAEKLAAALCRRGIERGDRVVIFMDNRWESAVSIFGALLAGGVFVVLNPQTKTEKLAYVLQDCGAKALITQARFEGVYKDAVPRSEALQSTLVVGSSFEQACAEVKEVVCPARDPLPLDLASLIYTSGSTGNPKGVMMSHESMVFATASLATYLRLNASHRIINVLPLAFDYGLYQLLMAVRVGATVVLERSFAYPAQVVQVMQQERVTVFPGVPTVFSMLLSMHDRSGLQLDAVQRVTNTAAALPAELIPKLRTLFPSALIYKMYGLTECKRVSYLEPEELDENPGSVGRAIPGTEAFVLNEQGTLAAPNEVGLLHVRGRHIMRGYWNRPDLTEQMLRPGPIPGERMLCTQDLFRMDERGYLYFVGRSDDIIKTKGEKVSPVEVERVLLAIDGVREAAVVGVPDPVLGQAIRAHVVLDHGAQLTGRDIRRACADRLEGFMVPGEVVLADDLPKTPSGKIDKRSL